jgi:hypothetical protein
MRDQVTPGICAALTRYVIYLYERYRLPIGKTTANLINVMCNSDHLQSDVKTTINYIRGVLSNPDYVATSEESLAFKGSTELYTEALDVNSPRFITVAAEDDDFAEGDDDDEDDLDEETDDTEEGDDLATDDDDLDDSDDDDDDSGDDDLDTDDDLSGDDDGDDGDDDADYEPIEEAAPNPMNTSDKVGIVMDLDKAHTLDSYLYRREVGYIIENLLKNPPSDVTTEDLAVLKRLKTQWLYLLSISSIHEILTKVVKIPVKLSE